MLSKEDNQLLCRVGPGTPMGALMREYWLAAVRSDELGGPHRPPPRGTPPGGAAPSSTPASPAALRFTTAVTRKRACAASTTAGSTAPTAPASTCQASRRS